MLLLLQQYDDTENSWLPHRGIDLSPRYGYFTFLVKPRRMCRWSQLVNTVRVGYSQWVAVDTVLKTLTVESPIRCSNKSIFKLDWGQDSISKWLQRLINVEGGKKEHRGEGRLPSRLQHGGIEGVWCWKGVRCSHVDTPTLPHCELRPPLFLSLSHIYIIPISLAPLSLPRHIKKFETHWKNDNNHNDPELQQQHITITHSSLLGLNNFGFVIVLYPVYVNLFCLVSFSSR